MSDPVWVRGYYGERYVLVDGREVLDLHTEAEARRFLEELGEKALDTVDPRALPPGLRSDFEAAGSSREDQIAVLAQMLSSGQFTVLRLQRPFQRLHPLKSVPLSSLRPSEIDEPPAKVKETFAYEVRLVDELGEPVEGVPLSLSVSGSSRRLVTDADGRVKVDDATTGTSIAQLPDLEALQDALRPRWEQPRDGEWLEESEDHTYIDCSDPLPSVRIRAERLHTIVVQPRVICARVLELLFDTNKSFLLPSALEHIRSIRKLYDQRPRAKVLIVGHTDTTGEPTINDPLSLNRAKAVAAYLRDDVQTWLDFYKTHMHPKARWGGHEDRLMLSAVLAESAEALTDTPVRHFQATRGLDVDGDLGPITREAIIAAYMAIDGTTLPAGIEPIAHGCGENFPLEQTRAAADTNADRAHDRRVELFFFDADLGVLPPPQGEYSGPDTLQYPEWRRRSSETHDFFSQTGGLDVFEIHLLDSRGQRMPGAQWRITSGGNLITQGTADDRGAIITVLHSASDRVTLQWRAANHPPLDPRYRHERELFVRAGEQAIDDPHQMLANLGYDRHADHSLNVTDFQADVGAPRTGDLEDIVSLLREWHNTGEIPDLPPLEAADTEDPFEPDDGLSLCGEDE